MNIVNFVKKIVNPLNIDIKKYPSSDLRRRKKLLEHHKVSNVLDVGANSGQYAIELFEIGYCGNIISFEPVKPVFNILNKKVVKNEKWIAFNFGLGDKEEKLSINISENTYSSSLLEIMPSHIKGSPESKYIDKELIQIKTLDSIYDQIVELNDVVLLKIDVQGFEKNVLAGAIKSLQKIKGIQLEMSIEELYKGEMLFDQMIPFLKNLGFNLYSLENGFYDIESGKLLQVDGIFFRE